MQKYAKKSYVNRLIFFIFYREIRIVFETRDTARELFSNKDINHTIYLLLILHSIILFLSQGSTKTLLFLQHPMT